MIHTSPHPSVAIPDVPLTDHVLRHADRLADAPALTDGATGRSLTYGELADAVRRLAGGLGEAGFSPGEAVALLAPNCIEYAIAFHGAAMAGLVVTTVNPTYTASEFRHQLQDSEATLVVTTAAALPVATEGAEGTAVRRIVTVDDSEVDSDVDHLDALYGPPLATHAAVSPATDVVALPYSSGTTGLSKGVMLTHRNLVANLVQVEAVLPVDEGEAVLSVLPFFHIYGMQVLMNLTLARGGHVVTLARFDLPLFLELAQQHRIRRAVVVPPIVLALAKHPLVDEYDLSSLQSLFSGAAPLGAELAAEAAARLDCEAVQGYGMTELSPVTHATPDGQGRPGTIGVLVPDTECRVVDPASGDDCAVGDDGELWIRGPQVMAGYLNNTAATAATIDVDGWLHTGDIGHVDDDGHFTIVDRLKELIKYKGFQVPPAELEALVVTHPEVADVAVVGIPDDEAGELPKAFVVRKPEATLDEATLMAWVADQVAHYKQLRVVTFVDEIPKSASGKILRRLLRDE
ncbi:MAG: AMP-binding protein [Acidimicrobiia bacterium]|nr:AMP-binding protein [Acidimicrobiia bacterium]